MSGWLMLEYHCNACMVTAESLEDRSSPPTIIRCTYCGQPAERVMSAPKFKTQLATVSRASRDDKPPPGACDTRPIADGEPTGAWRNRRKAERIKKRRDDIKKLLS